MAMQGVRTSNNIDVVAKFLALGSEVTWIVECKKWNTAVPQEKAQAFRTVVEDLGVDRGLLVAESGFQSGAHAAVKNSNVHLMTLSQLKKNVRAVLDVVRISDFTARIALAHHRYWQHGKYVRKDYDLRPDITSSVDDYYSSTTVLETAERVLKGATLLHFPIDSDTHMPTHVGPLVVNNIGEAIEWLDLNLCELEKRLDEAESRMLERGEYQPKPRFARSYWSTQDTNSSSSDQEVIAIQLRELRNLMGRSKSAD